MKNGGLKNMICVVLCFCLLLYFIFNGEVMAFSVCRLLGGFEYNGASSTVVSGDAFSVTGYGGGAYANTSAGDAPADVEVLKRQAESVFKNYTRAGSIKETKMGATTKTLVSGNIQIDNKTNQTISIQKLLKATPDLDGIEKEKPSILVYHTHTTEGYEMLDLGWYAKEYNSRTKDTNKNMVRVGNELVKALEAAGYKVIHDTTIYDSSYNGAYARSRVSVEKYLQQYPSIKVTLDVHRDAIHYDDKTRCKPTARINGKKAAQVMIISGCEGEGVEDFPEWYENLTFATHLQAVTQTKYPGLMRPVYFCHRKYNMDVTNCSLLLEFGTDANTLEEAVYSAQLVGESLAELLRNENK